MKKNVKTHHILKYTREYSIGVGLSVFGLDPSKSSSDWAITNEIAQKYLIKIKLKNCSNIKLYKNLIKLINKYSK